MSAAFHEDVCLCFLYLPSQDTYFLNNDEARTFATEHGIPHTCSDANWPTFMQRYNTICEIITDDAE